MNRPIGGFLGLELPSGDGGLRRLWGLGSRAETWVNARSALAALLTVTRNPVWMPAYLCSRFVATVPEDRLRLYPLGPDLSPDTSWLAARASQGDLVLAVNYFGRPPGAAFLDFVAARPDLWFIEDCAQAIDTGAPAFGDWRLYSPRKLLGVPDGGVLVPCSARARCIELPESQAQPDDPMPAVGRAQPLLARFEDVDEAHNEVWYALNRAKESALGVSTRPMSRLAWELLGLLDVAAISQARKLNYAALARQLPDMALFRTTSPTFVPLGFPIRVPAAQRSGLLQRLYRERIFPAVHWHPLHSGSSAFEWEPEWSRTLITLPCDQRYSPADMVRLASLVCLALT